MAKQTKKVTKKAAAKPKARKAAAKPPAKRAAKAATKRTPRPRAQTLPGMEQVRHTRLDGHCERISEIRTVLNEQRSMEADEARGALRYMHDKSITTYRFAGVELARVPGEEKLRIRASKEQATEETEDAGSGQDAGEIGEALTEPDDDEAAAADLEG